jgi:hypothetical protein
MGLKLSIVEPHAYDHVLMDAVGVLVDVYVHVDRDQVGKARQTRAVRGSRHRDTSTSRNSSRTRLTSSLPVGVRGSSPTMTSRRGSL